MTPFVFSRYLILPCFYLCATQWFQNPAWLISQFSTTAAHKTMAMSRQITFQKYLFCTQLSENVLATPHFPEREKKKKKVFSLKHFFPQNSCKNIRREWGNYLSLVHLTRVAETFHVLLISQKRAFVEFMHIVQLHFPFTFLHCLHCYSSWIPSMLKRYNFLLYLLKRKK